MKIPKEPFRGFESRDAGSRLELALWLRDHLEAICESLEDGVEENIHWFFLGKEVTVILFDEGDIEDVLRNRGARAVFQSDVTGASLLLHRYLQNALSQITSKIREASL